MDTSLKRKEQDPQRPCHPEIVGGKTYCEGHPVKPEPEQEKKSEEPELDRRRKDPVGPGQEIEGGPSATGPEASTAE